MRAWHYVAAFGLAALGFGASDAGPGVVPKPRGGFDPFRAKVETASKSSAATKPHLVIASSLLARRERHDVRLYATIQISGGLAIAGGVASATPTLTGTWTLYRQEGAGWKSVQQGNILVREREQFPLAISYTTTAATRFKLELRTHGTNVATSKQAVAPQLFYVVKYRLLEWKVKSGKTASEQVAAQNSINYANAYFALGFEALPAYEPHERLLASNYFTWQVRYRCVNWQERAFATNAAATEFTNSLPAFTTKQLILR